MSETHFGFATVPLDDKQRRVDDVFRTVARRYDLMNDLMSGGLHRAWKDALVTAINPPKSDRDFALLDVAGGTGDIDQRERAVAFGRINRGNERVLPRPMQPARHQVVHQIVAPRHRAEHVVDPPLLVVERHGGEAEMGLAHQASFFSLSP